MELDATLFEAIHRGLANPFFDAVLPVFRAKTTWVPLYLVMVGLLWHRYGWRPTLVLLLAIALTLGLADQLAASVLKPWVGRLRPCTTQGYVRELVNCGGRFSFPSNHATNHFALATLLALTWLRRAHPGWRVVIYAWATAISLAQVYVGKHWPTDVAAGAVLGTFLAIAGVYLYRRLAGEYAIPRPPKK